VLFRHKKAIVYTDLHQCRFRGEVRSISQKIEATLAASLARSFVQKILASFDDLSPEGYRFSCPTLMSFDEKMRL
jgi:hypothetical protein